jgi:hypothetical protein
MSTLKVYRLMDARTGLYSEGGYYGNPCSPVGKFWASLGNVKKHLRMRKQHPDFAKESPHWLVMEYELKVTDLLPVHEVLCEEKPK